MASSEHVTSLIAASAINQSAGATFEQSSLHLNRDALAACTIKSSHTLDSGTTDMSFWSSEALVPVAV